MSTRLLISVERLFWASRGLKRRDIHEREYQSYTVRGEHRRVKSRDVVERQRKTKWTEGEDTVLKY
jgi:hypothetical protein